MGFFNFRSTDTQSTQSTAPVSSTLKPTIPLVDELLSSGLFFNDVDGFLNNSDIYNAVNTISADLARLKFTANNNNDKLLYLLNERPNDEQSPFNFKFALYVNLLLYGNGFVLINRDKNGKPVSLDLLGAKDVTLKVNEKINKIYYEYNNDGDIYNIDKKDILHIKLFTVDGYMGVSPLSSLKYEISIENNSKKTINEFLKRGINVRGVIKLPKTVQAFSKEAKKVISDEFAHSSELGYTVLNDGWDFIDKKPDTSLLDFVNRNTFTRLQIAKAYRLNPNKFAVELVNTSDKEINEDYINNVLAMYLESMLTELNFKTEDNVNYTADFSIYQKENEKEKVELVLKKMNQGLITTNEAREELGYGIVDGGDSIRVNLGSIGLDKLNEYHQDKGENGNV